jgi:hypothetical protein
MRTSIDKRFGEHQSEVSLNLDAEGGSNYRRGVEVTRSAVRLTACCN